MCLSAVRLVVSFVSARTVATIHCTTYIIQWYAIRSCSRSYVSRNQGTVCVPWVYRDIQSDLVLYTLNNVKVQVFRSEPYQYPCSCWPYSKHVVPNLSEGYFLLDGAQGYSAQRGLRTAQFCPQSTYSSSFLAQTHHYRCLHCVPGEGHTWCACHITAKGFKRRDPSVPTLWIQIWPRKWPALKHNDSSQAGGRSRYSFAIKSSRWYHAERHLEWLRGDTKAEFQALQWISKVINAIDLR
jgi:hypothetical protein